MNHKNGDFLFFTNPRTDSENEKSHNKRLLVWNNVDSQTLTNAMSIQSTFFYSFSLIIRSISYYRSGTVVWEYFMHL